MIQSLGLADYEQAPTKEQLEKGLRNALRAKRLLDYPEMKWWLEEHVNKEEGQQFNRLLRAEDEKQADRARGSIQALRDITMRLQFMASKQTELEELLND